MKKRNLVLSNLIWKFAERISAQLISTIVSIILARLLAPDDYGVISMVMIFITIANVFVSDGFGSALIQKKDTTATDFFTVLYFNIGFSCILYLGLFLLAPLIANFYGDGYEVLIPVLRILGLRIILTAINTVQQAYISKKMMFKKFFISTMWGTICSAIVGITMAYAGFGVWALVTQYMVSTIVSTITLTISIRIRPKWLFSFDSLKELFPFGVRILGTSLLINGYEEAKALIVGKKYSSADLAFYNKGRQFPQLLITNINASIGAVLFPKMSNDQDDIDKIKHTMKASIRFSAYLMCPMMLGLAAVANNFIIVVLTEKWLPCVSILQLFCITYLFYPIHTTNMQATKAIGKSKVLLKIEIIKKIIEVAVFVITLWYGVNMIVLGMAICATIFTFINAYPNGKYIKYGFIDQMKDIMPCILMSVFMAICVYTVSFIPLNSTIMLILQVILGLFIYVLLSIIFKNKEFIYLKEFILGYFRHCE